MQNNREPKEFWKNIILAVDSQPRNAEFVRGASGQQHPILGIGLDEKRSRLILVSEEHDARASVLAQADIQSVVEPLKVITVRPVAINLSMVTNALVSAIGGTILTPEIIQGLQGKLPLTPEDMGPYLDPIFRGFKYADLNVMSQILQAIQQLAKIEIVHEKSSPDGKASGTVSFKLDSLTNFDPTQKDREVGICPVPMYEFSEGEYETIISGAKIDDIRLILQKHHILQFFYPPPDQLSLGLVDRGVHNPNVLLEQLTGVPEIGHPFGEQEIVPKSIAPYEVIDELRQRKLLVEGEIGYEISEQARSARFAVKFKPRESLLSKLINRFSVNIDLKDLFKGSS